MGHRSDGGIVRVFLRRLQSQIGGLRVVQSGLDVCDCWPGGGGTCPRSGVLFGVGHNSIQPRTQIPGQVVPVSVVILAHSARAAAGGRAHVLAGPPGAFLVTQEDERVLNVGVGNPKVWLQLHGRAKERQCLAGRATGRLKRDGPTVEQVGPIRAARSYLGRLTEGYRLRIAPLVVQVRGIKRRLRLTVHILGNASSAARAHPPSRGKSSASTPSPRTVNSRPPARSANSPSI